MRVKLAFNASNKIRITGGKIHVETAFVNTLQEPRGSESDLLDLQGTGKGSKNYSTVARHFGSRYGGARSLGDW